MPAMLGFITLSAISEPILSAGNSEPAGIVQADSCSESDNNESLDQDDPDQGQMHDETDGYDSYGDKEVEVEEKWPPHNDGHFIHLAAC